MAASARSTPSPSRLSQGRGSAARIASHAEPGASAAAMISGASSTNRPAMTGSKAWPTRSRMVSTA